MNPSELRYTRSHEWIRVDGDAGQVGITDYAQQQLGDVVFIELPEVGRRFAQGDQFGSVESVKAVSDLYCPVAGEVVEVNAAVVDQPESVNQDPYGSWLIRLKLDGTEQVAALLDAAAYGEMTST